MHLNFSVVQDFSSVNFCYTCNTAIVFSKLTKIDRIINHWGSSYKDAGCNKLILISLANITL